MVPASAPAAELEPDNSTKKYGRGNQEGDDESFLLHELNSGERSVRMLFDWIVTPRAERMTTQQSTYGQRAATQSAILPNRFCGVLGTGWRKSARIWKKR